MRFRFSRRALADLEEIAAYIARDNPARAISFIGVRMSVFGNYLVLYVVHPDLLEIRRVVHGARNLADID